MKIVHIITRLLRAGSEENTLLSCVSQSNSGHDVYVIHGIDYDSLYYNEIPQVKFIKAKNLVHKISPIKDIKGYYEIKSIIQNIKPDVIHTHQSKAGIIGRFAAWNADVPIIVNGIHIVPFANVDPMRKMIYLAAERRANRVTSFHIDVSEGVRRAYLDAGIGTEQTHEVIHSGFDVEKFRTAEPVDWKSLSPLSGLDTKPPIVLMLAAFEPRKRHAEFLAAVPDLLSRIPNAQILLVGGGPQQENIRAAIANSGLQNSVHILGYRTDPENLIALADVCCLVSEREGLPRVLMQYIAAGKPCVATKLPGIEEILIHNENSIVLQSDDIVGVVREISRVLQDSSLHGRLSEGARITNLNSWKSENMCDKILRLYDRLIQDKAS